MSENRTVSVNDEITAVPARVEFVELNDGRGGSVVYTVEQIRKGLALADALAGIENPAEAIRAAREALGLAISYHRKCEPSCKCGSEESLQTIIAALAALTPKGGA